MNCLAVVGDAVHVAVQVHAEQVERVTARLGDVVEELPRRAARLAAEHVVAAAAEDDRRGRVDLLDRAVHGLQLLGVLGRGARPEQAGVARLVVALPVPDAAFPGLVDTVPDHLADELGVRALVQGGRGRQEVGRLPGPPRRAGAQRDPELLVAGQLAEQGVYRVPAVLAGLGFDLRPVQVGPDQAGPQCAGLRHELPGRAEQAVADAAHHAEPDSPWLE
jgi:hypothetical protein